MEHQSERTELASSDEFALPQEGVIKIDMAAGRRAFLQGLGLSAAAATAVSAGGLPALAAGGVSDAEVLNFALNLEYLEAEFYLRALSGKGLPASSIGSNPGPVTGGSMVPFKDPLTKAYALEIAKDEFHHVNFLRFALGSAAVSRPAIDLKNSFNTLAQAAGLGNSFDPFASDTNFLLGAYIFEDVGVSAYHGAAGYLVDNLTYLNAAAGILAVEAYHAGLVRTVLFAQGQSTATSKISAVRQALGPEQSLFAQKTATDAGVGTNSMPNIVLVDGASIAYFRTTRAVLNIVYGAQNASKGLFFPNGLNGAIH